ncbi:MAG: DMT family transporter [Bacteroidales bacterium]|nr:DMT family transporter [Bacteroidales bacterium]
MQMLIWIALALIAGALLPVQASLNSKVASALGGPFYGAAAACIVTVIALLGVAAFQLPSTPLSWEGFRQLHWTAWLGGLIGALYLAVVILAFDRLGPAYAFCLMVFGQVLASLLMEHFNVLVAEQQPISLMRIVGLILVVGGIFLIRKF